MEDQKEADGKAEPVRQRTQGSQLDRGPKGGSGT